MRKINSWGLTDATPSCSASYIRFSKTLKFLKVVRIFKHGPKKWFVIFTYTSLPSGQRMCSSTRFRYLNKAIEYSNKWLKDKRDDWILI